MITDYMLYDRDYRILTEEDRIIIENANRKIKEALKNGEYFAETIQELYTDYTESAIHYQQLFPNNYFNRRTLDEKEKVKSLMNQFKQLLDNRSTEREMLNFIRQNKAYYITRHYALIVTGKKRGFMEENGLPSTEEKGLPGIVMPREWKITINGVAEKVVAQHLCDRLRHEIESVYGVKLDCTDVVHGLTYHEAYANNPTYAPHMLRAVPYLGERAVMEKTFFLTFVKSPL